jgi:hypothetical protein
MYSPVTFHTSYTYVLILQPVLAIDPDTGADHPKPQFGFSIEYPVVHTPRPHAYGGYAYRSENVIFRSTVYLRHKYVPSASPGTLIKTIREDDMPTLEPPVDDS